MTTTIIVREKAEQHESPERATVNLSIELTGIDRENVHNQVSSLLGDIRSDIENMRDDQNGPITWHTISNVSTWAFKQDDVVKRAEKVSLKAKFNDFTKLGEWLNSILAREGVRLSYIDWTLTEKRQKEVELELRQKAVRLARDKADQYATASDMHVVATKTIADAGLLSNNRSSGYDRGVMYSRDASTMLGSTSAKVDSYSLAPEDIVVSTSIEAEFLAE